MQHACPYSVSAFHHQKLNIDFVSKLCWCMFTELTVKAFAYYVTVHLFYFYISFIPRRYRCHRRRSGRRCCRRRRRSSYFSIQFFNMIYSSHCRCVLFALLLFYSLHDHHRGLLFCLLTFWYFRIWYEFSSDHCINNQIGDRCRFHPSQWFQWIGT